VNAAICFNATSESDTSFGYRNRIHESPCERGLSCCPLNRAPAHEAECRRQINETCQLKQRRHSTSSYLPI